MKYVNCISAYNLNQQRNSIRYFDDFIMAKFVLVTENVFEAEQISVTWSTDSGRRQLTDGLTLRASRREPIRSLSLMH